ncbi:MAG: transglutaminase domain-containing protein [Ruminococcus sp.]|nr:transglutaminase domain-containing protein [Ruminococcus sp.]
MRRFVNNIFIFCITLSLIISGLVVFNSQESAAGFVRKNSSVYYQNADNSLAKGWQTIGGRIYYFRPNGKMLVGLHKIDNKKFYFNPKGDLGSIGSLKLGWVKIGKDYYYFRESGAVGTMGKMLRNIIAGTADTGYYYVSKSGRRINDSTLSLAVKLVAERASQAKSPEAKLKKCFKFLKKYYPYKRRYGLPDAGNISEKYASYMFKHRKGNCYCFASSFALIAKSLGFDTRINIGDITTPGGGPSPHGWAEVKIKGKWYLFDISMHRKCKNIPLYKIPKGKYPFKYHYDKRYSLKIKNNRAVWKKA